MTLITHDIVPYKTLLIARSDNLKEIEESITNLCNSRRFGKKFTLYLMTPSHLFVFKKKSSTSPSIRETVSTQSDNLWKMIKLLRKEDISLIVDFARTPFSAFLCRFSGASMTVLFRRRRKLLKFSFLRLILRHLIYSKVMTHSLSIHDFLHSFIYTSSGYVTHPEGKLKNPYLLENTNQNDSVSSVPVDSENYLLWIPNIRKKKQLCSDFLALTSIACERKLSMRALFASEKDFKAFISVFYINGRKKEMESVMELVVSPKNSDENEILDEAEIIFVSSLRDSRAKQLKKYMGERKAIESITDNRKKRKNGTNNNFA